MNAEVVAIGVGFGEGPVVPDGTLVCTERVTRRVVPGRAVTHGRSLSLPSEAARGGQTTRVPR